MKPTFNLITTLKTPTDGRVRDAHGLPYAEGTGISTQPNKYNGKEFIEMHGYDEYDYGWRGLYSAIGRFTTIDLLAEKYYDVSPYAYCANNPIMLVDPDGKKVEFAQGVSDAFKNQFATTIKYMNSKGTAGILKAIHDKPEFIYITESKKSSSFSPKTRTINWNPTMGVITDEGVVMSPATVLNHEADHALQELVNPEQKVVDKQTMVEGFPNAEEKRVITGSEQTTARKHGEIKEGEVTRKDYNGQMYETESPTSTQGKYEVVVIPNKKEK